MTDEIAHARCQARRTLVNPTPGNDDQSFGQLGSYVDGVKSLFGPRLDNRIRWVLQEFAGNSKSRYAEQFPRVKKFLDIVAAWADRIEASGKGTDIRREMIKRAIEYLVRDGSVTQFADPALFNSGPNKVDPDSLAAERNVFKSMNVCRFINEKDYWLCQDCAIDSTDSENCNSDLDVEVGSPSRETSTVYYTCRTTSCGPLCDENVDFPNTPQTNVDCQNFHLIIDQNQNTLNPPQENANTCHHTCCDPTEKIPQNSNVETRCTCNDKIENSKSLHTQTSLPLCYLVFNLHQNVLNPHQEPSHDNPILNCCSTKEIAKLSDKGITCNITGDAFPRISKLKLYVHKATSTSDNKIRNPPKVSNLSLPCESSQLIVRLFEADPSLSDSCLILMKKKFEKDIRNACSCMNDSLKKLEADVIKQLCLNCVIRPGRVNLNVGRRKCGCPNPRRFLARVPTCSSVHKRDPGPRNPETAKDRRAERPVDLPIDSSSAMGEREEEFEQRKVDSFYISKSPGSTGGFPAKREIGKEEEKGEDVGLMWNNGKKKKRVAFALPSKSKTKNAEQEDSIGNGENDRIFDKEKSTAVEQERSDAGYKIAEDRAKANESDSHCSCSTDSLKGDTLTEENSANADCNSEECFCRALLADGGAIDQHAGRSSLETANREEVDGEVCRSRDLEEGGFPVKEFALSKDVFDGNKANIADESKAKEVIFEKEGRGGELKNRGATREFARGVEENISDKEQEIQSVLEVCDKISVDSIWSENSLSALNSCGSKCSNCGNDLFSSLFDKDTIIDDNPTVRNTDTDIKTDQTPTKSSTALHSSILKETSKMTNQSNTGPTGFRSSILKESQKITAQSNTGPTDFYSSKIKESPKVTDQSNTGPTDFPSSILKETSRMTDQTNTEPPVPDNDPTNLSQEYPQGSPQNSSIDSEENHEDDLLPNPELEIVAQKCPSIPESLFVFCRETSLKYSSSTTNSTSDDECMCYDYLSTRHQRARTKFQLPCDRPIPATFQRRTSHLGRCDPSCSTRNLCRANSAKPKTRRKASEEDGDGVEPRYKNRLWRGSIVPGSLCSSFPAIDRLKYLIRRKLRKLLLEERDKGTSTSKTYLRNERYLVSVSSGKLSREMVVRESCSTRCPFTARNRFETEAGPDTTFTEGGISKKTRQLFVDSIRDRCQRLIQGHGSPKKISIAKVSRTVRQRRSSKSTDTQDLMYEKSEVFAKSKFRSKKENKCPTNAPVERRDRGKISSGLSLNSGMFVMEDEEERFLKNHDLRRFRNNRNFVFDANVRSGYNECGCSSSSGSSPDNKRNARELFGRDRPRREVFRPFEKRLFRIEEDGLEDYDFVRFFSDYEKRINDLDADFRSKLLQYVALCRSVKNSLIKRLQTDDVYEVSSSSAWGRKSFRD